MNPTRDSKGRPYTETFFDPTMLNGVPFNSIGDKTWGEVYPALPALAKFRRNAAEGNETEEDKRAYGRAVGAAFKSLVRHRYGMPKWSWKVDLHYDTGREVRASMNRAIASALASDRAKRTDEVIKAEYEHAMKLKAERIAREAAAPTQPQSPAAIVAAPAQSVVAKPKAAQRAPKRAPAPVVVVAAVTVSSVDMPAPPQLTEDARKRLRVVFERVTSLAEARDLQGLRTYSFPTSSGSRMKLEKFRQLAIVAIEAQRSQSPP